MLESFDKEIIKLKELAITSNIYYKHAAGLILNNEVITYSINKHHSFRNNKTIHAEISLFLNLKKKNLKGCDIIVIRVDKKLKLKNSRPCNHCIEKLKMIGVRKVFYSTEDGFLVSEILNNMKKLHVSSGNKY